MSNNSNGYKYLAPRPGSSYRQFFVSGRNLRACFLYAETLGPGAQTPEEVAEDYDVPVEAVHEAIDYCRRNMALLIQENDEEKASIRAHGWDRPPYVPADYQPTS